MLIKNAVILTEDFRFEKKDLRTSGDKIIEIGENLDSPSEIIINADDCYIVPGLVDIHTHGCMGFDSSKKIDHKTIDSMSRFYAENGTTTYFPTIESNTFEDTVFAAENLSKAHDTGVSGANIGGIHLEGPYFSFAYKGAQNENCLRLPDIEELKKLSSLSKNRIRIISLAPELAGAFEFIEFAKDICTVAIGHTDADYEEAKKGIEHGATLLTHTFNGMRPMHHRSPNAIGAALESNIFCEFICDGFHVSEPVVKLMYKFLTDSRMVLISDSLSATGMPDGLFELAGLPVHVRGGKAFLNNGTIAGSTVTLFECVKNMISWGIPAESAFKMATINPAKATKTQNICGSISVGKRADFILLNKDYSIKDVYVRGDLFR